MRTNMFDKTALRMSQEINAARFGVTALKTAYGGIVYARADDIASGCLLIALTDKAGRYRHDTNGNRIRAARGYVLDEEPQRRVVAWFETFPDGSRRRGYWYADDMVGGFPRHASVEA
jgi:hypothetical protein